MSDLLDGSTEHHQYAPLSTAQTISISRHLADQIKQLQILGEDHARELRETQDGVAALKEKMEGNTHAIHELNDGMNSNKATVDSNRKWLSRVSTTMTKMQTSLDNADEGISALRDAEQVNGSSLRKIAEDLSSTSEMTSRLQAGERRSEVALRTLQDELAKVNLQLQQVRNDDEALKKSMHDGWESIRDNAATSKSLHDSLDETNTLVKIIERRLGDSVQNGRTMKQDAEEMNSQQLKFHEDHENSKAHLAELQNVMRRVTQQSKVLQEGFEKNTAKLELGGAKQGDGQRAIEGLSQAMEEIASSVQSLQQSQTRTGQNLQHLQRELQNVASTTQAVKAGLKEQSSLLLPNIQMDSMDARNAVGRHGSMLGSIGANH